MKKVFLLGMMFLIALTMQAQKRCVVLEFQVGSNVTNEEVDGISYVFRSNFHPSNYIKLEHKLVSQIIRVWGYSHTEMTQQQIVKIGRELEANIVVVGYLNKFMDEYSVDLRVIDVAMGNTILNESVNFPKSSYRDAMENAAKKLATKLGGEAKVPSKETVAQGYTDLGLPSGTIWKNFNATGFYSYDEAFSQFGNRLPSKAQWEELKAECQWTWTGNEYKVTGPNGNSIIIPAAGYRDKSMKKKKHEGTHGFYFSSSPKGAKDAWYLNFYSRDVNLHTCSRLHRLSVRLVQD